MNGKESEKEKKKGKKSAPLAEPLCSLMRRESAAASGGRGTWIWQNFTSERTQKANFDFVPGFFVCSASTAAVAAAVVAVAAPAAPMQTLPSLHAETLHPQLFPFASDHICKLSFLLLIIVISTSCGCVGSGPGLDRGRSPGVCRQAAVTHFSRLPTQVKCHVLSGKL